MKESWREKSLDDVCSITSKLVDPREESLINQPHIGAGNIVSMSKELTDVRTAKEEGLKSGKFCFDNRMVLYSKIRPYLIKIAIPDFSGLCSADIYPLTPKNEELDRTFLYYLLLTKNFTEYAIAGSARAGMPKVNRSHFFKYKTFIPPLPEQKHIVSILDEAFAGIDQAIANTEKNLANARELFESHLNNVFTQKGEGWVDGKLSDFCDVRDGTHDSPKYVENGIPFVTQKNIRLNGLNFDKTKFISDIDHEKFYKRSNVKLGDILVSMIGVNRGMSCLVDDDRIFSIKNVGLIKHSDKVNMSFLLYYLKSNTAKTYVDEESRGGAQPFIGLTKLRNFPVTLAPIKHQQSIIEKLNNIQSKTRTLQSIYQQKLNSLQELKQSILQKAFTGELTADYIQEQVN